MVDSFRSYVDSEIDYEQQFKYSKEQETSLSKKCALIVIIEILKSIESAQYRTWHHEEMTTEYWNEVMVEVKAIL